MAYAESPVGLLNYAHSSWAETTTGPLLLGYNGRESSNSLHQSAWMELPPHGDEGQVELDVHRSFIYYPKGMDDHRFIFIEHRLTLP